MSYIRHGLTNTRVYRAWKAMKQRCYSVDWPQYKDYGGRGITVCDEWKNDVIKFRLDMGDPENGMQLDRIDNDGNYSLDNCRWATRTQQHLNKRKIRNASSNFIGVKWSSEKNKWQSGIKIEQQYYHIGYFEDELLAYQVYEVVKKIVTKILSR